MLGLLCLPSRVDTVRLTFLLRHKICFIVDTIRVSFPIVNSPFLSSNIPSVSTSDATF